MTIIISLFVTSLLSIVGKFASQAFFEAVLTRLILWGGDKLAAISSNQLDNELMAIVRQRLTGEVTRASLAAVYQPLMDKALAAKDFEEYARLHNELISSSQ